MSKKIVILFKPTQSGEDYVAKAIMAIHKMGYSAMLMPADSVVDIEDAAREWRPDLVVALGGDGTVLRALRLQTPVLAFNAGTVGFLADHPVEYLQEALLEWDKEEFNTSIHVPLEVSRTPQDPIVTAFNDLVIQRDPQDPMVMFNVSMGDEPLAPLRADGLIISTPTGSTGYSLSAGGPVLPVGMLPGGVVLTPICARGGVARPLVVPIHTRIEVRTNRPVKFLADGRLQGESDRFVVRGGVGVDMIHTDYAQPFMEALTEKLGWSL